MECQDSENNLNQLLATAAENCGLRNIMNKSKIPIDRTVKISLKHPETNEIIASYSLPPKPLTNEIDEDDAETNDNGAATSNLKRFIKNFLNKAEKHCQLASSLPQSSLSFVCQEKGEDIQRNVYKFSFEYDDVVNDNTSLANQERLRNLPGVEVSVITLRCCPCWPGAPFCCMCY